ncbi:MAG: hypothetical protein LBT15_01530 [Synergistaceae bacterium]|jgi:hypothetical protein|nr:hypothetical protein [Synergistaceae bacterium]
MCRRAFINGPQGEDICSDCTVKLQDLYPVVRSFLRDHEKTSYTVYDISRILGISPRQVEALVSLGMIDTDRSGRALREEPRKAPKITPLDPETSAEILKKKGGSSMHTYTKKIEDEEKIGGGKRK